jgi:hypothetical protein
MTDTDEIKTPVVPPDQPDTRIGFIREKCPKEIKIKEAELGRPVEIKDVPTCLGGYLSTHAECIECVVKVACIKWGEIYESKEQAKPEHEKTEVKPEKAKSRAKKEPKAKIKTEPDGVPDESPPVHLEAWGIKDGDWTIEDGNKVFPKGYVKDKIMKLLKAGTTRAELKALVDWMGYGEATLGWTLRELRKAKKLIEDKDGNVKSKEV